MRRGIHHGSLPSLLGLSLLFASAALQGKDTPAKMLIRAPYVDLHSGPGRSYPVTCAVAKGETVTLERQRTNWIKVSTRRQVSGWAQASDLFPATPQTPAGLAPGHWQTGLTFGDFQGARSTSLLVGYQLSAHFTAEVILTQVLGDFSDSRVGRLQLKHTTWPSARLSPVFGLGAGKITTSPDATLVRSADRTDSVLTVTLGGRYQLAQRYLLSVDYSNHLILTSRNQNEEVSEWKLGISASL